MPVKKKIVVVKSLRDVSPKKQLLVSRSLQGNEMAEYEPSSMGNHSPQKPLKQKDGSYASRSILGDPATFENLEQKLKLEAQQATSNDRVKTSEKAPSSSSRFGTRGRSSPVSASNIPEEENVTESPDRYLESLSKQQRNATKIQSRDVEKEASLLQYLPVNERFSHNKEEKVLLRWQERQKEWEKIEAEVSYKIGASNNHALLMGTTEEFRAKKEEYDLLQAAIPLKDRFGPNSWSMTLRGGCPRTVTIGHIFSGLECEVDKLPPKPYTVRKPLPGKKFKTGTTFLEETASFLEKKKRLTKEISAIRPHDISFDDAASMVIHCEDLFDWAINSTQEHFGNMKASSTQDVVDLLVDDISKSQSEEMLDCKGISQVDIVTSNVVMSTITKKSVVKKISIKNTGTTVVFFQLKRYCASDENTLIPQDASSSNSNHRKSVTISSSSQSLAKSNSDLEGHSSDLCQVLDAYCKNKPNRERSLRDKRHMFYCVNPDGKLFPQQSVDLYVTFFPEFGGIFRERWDLVCTPRARVNIKLEDGVKVPSSVSHDPCVSSSSNDGEYRMSPVPLMMAAHVFEEDETIHSRVDLKSALSHSTLECMIKDEFSKCLFRVRDSIRPEDLVQRKIDLFCKLNQPLLDEISGKYGTAMSFDVSIDRIDRMGEICVDCAFYSSATAGVLKMLKYLEATENLAFIKSVIDQFTVEGLKKKKRVLDYKKFAQWLILLKNVDIPQDVTSADSIASLVSEMRDIKYAHCLPDQLQSIRELLLPEGDLDIFDQVEISEFYPSWDYSLQAILSRISSGLFRCEDIRKLESSIFVKLFDFEKVLRKQERQEAKRIAREAYWWAHRNDEIDEDDDDEDDGAEEEEEEEEQIDEEEDEEDPEEESAIHARHPLVQQGNHLLSTCWKNLLVLTSHPLDHTRLSTITSEALSHCFDEMDVIRDHALEASGLQTPAQPFTGHIPAMESPFTSEHGFKQWEAALQEPDEPVPAAGGGKKGGGGKSGGGGSNSSANGAVNPQQVNRFYKHFYHLLREELLKSLGNGMELFDRSMESLSAVNLSKTMERVFSTASFRAEDAMAVQNTTYGRFAFVNSPGDLFCASDLPMESPRIYAFASLKHSQKTFFNEIKQLSYDGSQRIILFFDACSYSSDYNKQCSWMNSINIIQQGLFDVNAEYVAKERKLHEKRRRKWNKENRKLQKKIKRWQRAFPDQILTEDLARSLDLYLEPLTSSILDHQYDVKFFNSMVDLTFEVTAACQDSPIEVFPLIVDETLTLLQRRIPVYVVENLKAKDVIPLEPVLVDEVIEEDDAPICIGDQEYKDYRQTRHDILRPHQVTVQTSSGKMVKCFADAGASVADLFQFVQKSTFGSLFVDATTSNMFISSQLSSMQSISNIDSKPIVLQQQRVLSSSLRESLYYSSLFHGLRLLKSLGDSEEALKQEMTTRKLFSFCSNPLALRSLVIIGGKILADKFRCLDELIDLVDEVQVAGEMAIPFIAHYYNVSFTKHLDVCVKYATLCQNIIARARCRGSKLTFPTDIIIGDQPLLSRQKASQTIFNVLSTKKSLIESRDEGYDFDGETKKYPLKCDVFTQIDGYLYDIGEESAAYMANTIKGASLIAVWGVPGAVECSNFQLGTRKLVEAICPKDVSTQPLRSLIIGDDTVEWFSRLVDPDGEMEGNLARYGRISHCQRDSTLFAGICGGFKSSILHNGILLRAPIESDFVFTPVESLEAVDEEEEEEDD